MHQMLRFVFLDLMGLVVWVCNKSLVEKSPKSKNKLALIFFVSEGREAIISHLENEQKRRVEEGIQNGIIFFPFFFFCKKNFLEIERKIFRFRGEWKLAEFGLGEILLNTQLQLLWETKWMYWQNGFFQKTKKRKKYPITENLVKKR